MQCSSAKELLSSYLDKQLDKQSSMQLEEHLAGCEACRREINVLTMLVSELKGLEPVKAPQDFLDQLHARLEPRPLLDTIFKKLFFPLRIKIPLELATAAAIAVLVIGLIDIQQKERHLQRTPQVFTSYTTPEKKKDSKQLSRKLKKAEPTSISKQPASYTKEPEIQAIVLTMVVKPVKSVLPEEALVFQQAPSKPSPEKAMGVADEENRSVSYFSAPQRASEVPVEDALKSVAPGASLPKDNRQFEEKDLLNLKQTRYRVEKLVQALEGNVLSARDDQPAPDQQSMTANIPAGRYNEFVVQLGHIAPFQTPPPSPPTGQTLIRVEIRFISPN